MIDYKDIAKRELKRILFQVKSELVNSDTVRDLVGNFSNENTEIGVLLTLESTTNDMITAASTVGFYHSQFW